MPSLFLDHALLPQGWSANVRMDIESGRIAAVTADAHADGAQHCPGVALPGLPNLHSHTFQRGMAGFAERRGDSEDNFWTWRQVMYHFLGLLTPDDIEAIAAFAFVEMLESGFTSVAEFHYLHHAPDGRPRFSNPLDRFLDLAGRAETSALKHGFQFGVAPHSLRAAPSETLKGLLAARRS